MDGVLDPDDEQVWLKVGAEMRRLRNDQGISLAELAHQVHYSTGYLSKIETGKKRITREVAHLADEALETGGVLVALLPHSECSTSFDDRSDPVGTEVCPYPGLVAFGPQEACWFFGRDHVASYVIGQLDVRLAGGGPLAMVAPSGAGKSSLLAAGLIPALTGGALPGSRAWPVVVTTPGAHPLATLGARVAERTGADPAEVAAAIADPEEFAAFLTGTVAGHGGKQRETPSSARIVLIVDQFEETFTECQQEPERQAFITALCTAARSAAVLVVLGVRADFYGHCLAYPALLTALQDPVALGPMSVDQLRAIITGPAEAEGLQIEPGLVELLLRDLGVTDDSGAEATGYDPGALPLLAHALRATWQQRSGRLLTVAGYRRTGGIREAIATTAERAYTRLGPSEQRIAQQLLLRLVQVGDQTGEVRRRVPRDRLIQAMPAPAKATGKVLETFARARLLTFDAASVEITHEALLWAWPRLTSWITADRMGLRIHQLLSEAAEAWEAEDYDPSLVYRGSRLAIAQDWATDPGRKDQLNELEAAYLQVSIDQNQREQQADRRRTRRLHKLVGVLAISLVVTLIAGGITFQQYQEADRLRRLAIAAELTATSHLAASTQPGVAMLMAVEANHLGSTAGTRGALLSAQSQHFAGQLTGHTGIIHTATFSHDKRILATAGEDGTARLWDLNSRQPIATLDGRADAIYDAEFHPDDRILATAGEDGIVRLWDIASRKFIATLQGHVGAVHAATFSHDKRSLATVGEDGTARLWDLTNHQQIAILDGHADPAPVYGAAFSPDGDVLATANADRTARLWDLTSYQQIATLPSDSFIKEVTFSPKKRILATVGDTTATLWDVDSRQVIATLTGRTDTVNAAAFSPDGQILVTGSNDGTARLWDVSTHQTVGTLGGYHGFINDVAFNPDGRTLATVGEDGIARLWDTGGPILIPSPPTTSYNVEFSPDGKILATANKDGTTWLWDVAAHQSIATLRGHVGAVHAIAFSLDGHILATAGEDGTTRLWDITRIRDVATHQPIAILPSQNNIVIRSMAFSSSDGRILATAGDDGITRLWDITRMPGVANRQPYASLPDDSGIVSVSFSRNGSILATADIDGITRLWDVATHQPIATLLGRKAVFSPDDRVLTTVGEDGTAHRWELATGGRWEQATDQSIIAVLPGENFYPLAFTPNGHTLATTSGDTTVRLWDMKDRQPIAIAILTGHISTINAAAFSQDGLLATVSEDGTVRLWDLNTDRVTTQLCHIIGTVSEKQWDRFIPNFPYQPTCGQHQ